MEYLVSLNQKQDGNPNSNRLWTQAQACLFNSISTIEGYLMPKPFFKKNSSGTI